VLNRVLISLIIGSLVSVACFWYAFRGVDLSAMAAGMELVNPLWILASVGGALLGLIVRAFRWRLLLVGGTTIGSWSLVSATFIGIMANNVLPARFGEVVRAWVLARRERTSVPTVLASIVVERLLDVVAALALLGLALAVSSDLGGGAANTLKQTGQAVLMAVATGVSALLIAVHFRERLLKVGEGWAVRSRRPWSSGSLELIKRFLEGLCVLRSGLHAMAVAGLSLLVWVVAIASFHVMARGFQLGLTPVQTTLVFVVVLFGMAIPSAPGFVGTFHGFCVAGLAMVAGTEPTPAAAYATLLHGSHWLSINAVGLGCLLADRSLTWNGLSGMIRQT
jgi:hypothetical protein